MLRTSSAIACPVCSAPAGQDCAGMLNHISRGLALAVERSPHESVSAHSTPSSTSQATTCGRHTEDGEPIVGDSTHCEVCGQRVTW